MEESKTVKVLITRCIQCGCLMEPGSAQCGYAYTPNTPMRERTWDAPGIWYAVHSMISAPCFDAAPRTERGRMEWPKDPNALIEEVELKDGWLFAHEPVEEPTFNDIIEEAERRPDPVASLEAIHDKLQNGARDNGGPQGMEYGAGAIPSQIAELMEAGETVTAAKDRLFQLLNVEKAELRQVRGKQGENLKREAEIEFLLGLLARLGDS